MVAAHRGCWSGSDAPENSLAALDACIEIGVDIMEIDLRLTVDDQLVLSHDASLGRMTGVDISIEDHTLADLQDLPLRARDGGDEQRVTSETPLSFAEALEHADRRILFILDIKGPHPDQVAARAAEMLLARGDCDIAMFAYVASPQEMKSEFDPLLNCAGFLPNLRVPMGVMSDVAVSYKDLNPVAVAVRFDDWAYLYEGADEVHDLPARLWVNTLSDYHAGGLTDADALSDPDALWGRLIDAGVNMIQTDEPAALITYLNSRKVLDLPESSPR